MRSWMIAFSAGIFAAGFLPVLPAQLLQVAMLMTALLLHLLPGAARAGAMLLGVWWLCHTSAVLLARQWPVEDRLAEVWVTGVVTGLPRATSTGQRFAFQVQTRCAIEGTEPCAHATTLNPPPLVQLTAYEPFRPAPGQQWRLLVRLRPLHGFMNPGGYDY
jgi:competence protein ComEC